MRDFFFVLSILASYFGEVRSQFEEAGIIPFDANKFGLRLVVKNVDHAWEISHLRFYKDEDCTELFFGSNNVSSHAALAHNAFDDNMKSRWTGDCEMGLEC